MDGFYLCVHFIFYYFCFLVAYFLFKLIFFFCQVSLEDAESAIALRKAFSRFTRKQKPLSRPPELDGVEVYSFVTLASRVRTSILRVSLFNL